MTDEFPEIKFVVIIDGTSYQLDATNIADLKAEVVALLDGEVKRYQRFAAWQAKHAEETQATRDRILEQW